MKSTVATVFTIAMALITAIVVYGLYEIGIDGRVVAGIGFGMVICTGIVAVIGGDVIEEEVRKNEEEGL